MRRQGIPLPVELVLATIDVESGGKAGVVHPRSKAAGLMQLLPATLKDYNRHHAVKILYSELAGTTDFHARKQIRAGLWVLAMFWRGAYRYLTNRSSVVSTDDLAKIADLFYRRGPGATKKKLATLPVATYLALASAYPDWKPLRHVKRVWERLEATPVKWNLDDISDWLHSTSLSAPGRRPLDGFILAAIILALAYMFFKGVKNVKKD